MKCPKCGNEIRDEHGRCPVCGAELPHPEADGRTDPLNAYSVRGDPGTSPARETGGAAFRIKTAVKAVCAVILYLFLFFAVQSCICSVYALSGSDSMALMGVMQAGSAEEIEAATLNYQEQLVRLITENETRLLLAANLIAVLVLCLLLRLRGKKPAEELDFHGVNPLRLLQFALFGVAVNVALTVLLSVIPLPESVRQMQEAQYAGIMNDSIWWTVLSVGIMGPAAEEVFFRGIALTRLQPAIGTAGAILVSAVLFGLAHVTPLAVGYAFVVGLLLALIWNRYRSILPCIVCHCCFNLTSLWLDGVEGSGKIGVLTVLSAAAIVLIWRSAMIRFPSFSDVFHDLAGCIPLDDPEKKEIAEECRRIRTSDADIGDSLDRIEELADRWDRIGNAEQQANGPDKPDKPDDPDNPDGSENPEDPKNPEDPE